MKTKDIIYIVLAAVIFTILGVVIYQQFFASKQKNQVTYEVITPINSGFNKQALETLKNPLVARDFAIPVDLKTGLDNTKPFGSF